MTTVTEQKPIAAERTSARLYPLRDEGPSDALVIHCADPRFQQAFAEFIKEELGIERPSRISVPGSTSSFAVQGFLPKNWHALRKQIELMAEHNAYPRVVIIDHEDCKGYAAVAQYLGRLIDVQSAQRKYLKALAKFLAKEFLPQARFELYRARIVQNGTSRAVQFEKVL